MFLLARSSELYDYNVAMQQDLLSPDKSPYELSISSKSSEYDVQVLA